MSRMKRKNYEKFLEPMQAELVEMARWVPDTGQRWSSSSKAATPPARAARSRRLGQAQSAPMPRRRFGQAERARGRPMVFSALRPASAGQGRDRPVRSQLVQSRRRRAGDGLLHERSRSTPSSRSVPDFEQQLVDNGILLFKYWLCCDQEEQEERFAERLEDPLKRWKLSPIDLRRRAPTTPITPKRAKRC